MDKPHPLEVLSEDHQAGLVQLERLVEAAEDLRRHDLIAAREKLRGVIQFFEQELPVHFRLEEEALFPELEKPLAGPGPLKIGGVTPDICSWTLCDIACAAIGPLPIYLADHDAIRESIERLRGLSGQLDGAEGDSDIVPRLIEAATDLQWGLGSHIAKEENALLPKAREVLDDSALRRLKATMEQVKKR